MAFPASLETLAVDKVNSTPVIIDHPAHHNDLARIVNALQVKTGIDSSAVNTTIDYKLSTVSAGDKVVSLNGAQAITAAKTFGSALLIATRPKITTSIDDTNGNEVIKTPATASAINEITVTNAAIGNAPAVTATGDDTNINLTISPKGSGTVNLGSTKIGTAALPFPNSDGAANQFLQTNGAGVLSWAVQTSTTPQWIDLAHLNSSSQNNQYMDVEAIIALGSTSFTIDIPGYPVQTRVITTDWASATLIRSAVLLGAYIYVHVNDNTNYRVYRFDKTNLAGGGTLMTISGQAFGTTGGNDRGMQSDGTNFWFNYKAGGSANAYVLSKYTISGTTLTYVADTTCGSTAGSTHFFAVKADGNIFGVSNSDGKIRKFNSSGTLQYTSTGAFSLAFGLLNYADTFYIGFANSPVFGYAKFNVT